MSAAAQLGSNLQPAPSAKKPPIGLPPTVRIILEENDNIPPNGLFVGVNGVGYLIRPGEEVNVPASVVDVLEHAVMASPHIDPMTRQIVGYRQRMRYPFRKISVSGD